MYSGSEVQLLFARPGPILSPCFVEYMYKYIRGEILYVDRIDMKCTYNTFGKSARISNHMISIYMIHKVEEFGKKKEIFFF